MAIKLYEYWRSSASYRLRIALELKGVAYETVQVDLHPDVQAQKQPKYRTLNPQMRVPALEIDGEVIGQSMAILEWIEEKWPMPSLLPGDATNRLRIRAFADTIACDVHPLNNPSVLNVLRDAYGVDNTARNLWYGDWIKRGFAALEARYTSSNMPFLFGERPSLAEVCLIPQVYNARRFDVDLSEFPNLVAIDQKCCDLLAFAAASPTPPTA